MYYFSFFSRFPTPLTMIMILAVVVVVLPVTIFLATFSSSATLFSHTKALCVALEADNTLLPLLYYNYQHSTIIIIAVAFFPATTCSELDFFPSLLLLPLISLHSWQCSFLLSIVSIVWRHLQYFLNSFGSNIKCNALQLNKNPLSNYSHCYSGTKGGKRKDNQTIIIIGTEHMKKREKKMSENAEKWSNKIEIGKRERSLIKEIDICCDGGYYIHYFCFDKFFVEWIEFTIIIQ